MICLDTNIVIAILNRNPEVAQHRLVAALGTGDKVAISAVVFFELRFGVEGSNRREHSMNRLDLFLASPVDILPFDADDAGEAAAIRIALERAGTPIGPFDLLIAAQARRRGAPIVTANRREFERVPGLQSIDWTR